MSNVMDKPSKSDFINIEVGEKRNSRTVLEPDHDYFKIKSECADEYIVKLTGRFQLLAFNRHSKLGGFLDVKASFDDINDIEMIINSIDRYDFYQLIDLSNNVVINSEVRLEDFINIAHRDSYFVNSFKEAVCEDLKTKVSKR